jgi:cutinase
MDAFSRIGRDRRQMRSMASVVRHRSGRSARSRWAVVALAAVSALLPLVVVPVASAPGAAASHCTPVVLMGARGSGESADSYRGLGGVVGPLYDQLKTEFPEFEVIGANTVDYPAVDIPWSSLAKGLIGRSKYDASVEQGVQRLVYDLERQVDACGDEQRFILAGYSQGAQVVTEALGRVIGKQEITSKVIGVALFGSPLFSPGDGTTINQQSTGPNAYDAKLDGIMWPKRHKPSDRSLLGTWSEGTARARSYCLRGDAVCNYKFRNLRGILHWSHPHYQYVSSGYVSDAYSFLAGRIRAVLPPTLTLTVMGQPVSSVRAGTVVQVEPSAPCPNVGEQVFVHVRLVDSDGNEVGVPSAGIATDESGVWSGGEGRGFVSGGSEVPPGDYRVAADCYRLGDDTQPDPSYGLNYAESPLQVTEAASMTVTPELVTAGATLTVTPHSACLPGTSHIWVALRSERTYAELGYQWASADGSWEPLTVQVPDATASGDYTVHATCYQQNYLDVYGVMNYMGYRAVNVTVE